MGLFDVFTEKCSCSICDKSGNKLFMYDLSDGKICGNCFDKLGRDNLCSKYSLNQAIEIIQRRQNLIALSDVDYLFGDKQIFNAELKESIRNARSLKTDLLEADYPKPASKSEAIYRGRIFSISGKDKKFPKLPKEELSETRICLYPFLYGSIKPLYCKPSQEIKYSNRPFVDDRDDNEKVEYGKIVEEILQKRKNQEDYEWITKHLPDIAPKSLSGYSRMKNSNSKNYQKLQKAALKKGRKI